MRYLRLLTLILPESSSLLAAKSSLSHRYLNSNCSKRNNRATQLTPTLLLALFPKSKQTPSQHDHNRNPRNNLQNTCFGQMNFGEVEKSPKKFTGVRQMLTVSWGGTDYDEYLLTKKNRITPKMKISGIIILASAISFVIFRNQDAISSFDFKKFLASHLDTLASLGTPGLVLYTFFFMLWELTLGVTTPVETAAGMAFGLKKGIVANAVGKTSGALFAFLLGRSVLSEYATKKLEGNEYMDLVQSSILKKPIRVALIWRFSFLPEFVKNFGLAILPVKTWQFATAVFMHGFPFTILWTFMGNEMGGVIRGICEPSRILKLLLVLVYVFGFFISPALVGLWVKSLQDEKKKRLAEQQKK